jgi:GTP-binding protein
MRRHDELNKDPTMGLRHARFLCSALSTRQLPVDAGLEVAFAGRSNSGKSSAINAIAGVNRLARASKTPGRTQTINFFELPGERRLVDLPGYGYAKVPEAMRMRWRAAIESYLDGRRSLAGMVVVMDVRNPLRDTDQMLLDWCLHRQVAVHLLLTKADKLSRGRATDTLRRVKTQAGAGVGAQLFSATRSTGVETARLVVCDWLKGPGTSPGQDTVSYP